MCGLWVAAAGLHVGCCLLISTPPHRTHTTCVQVSYAIKQVALAAAAAAATVDGGSRKRARGQNGAPAAAAASGSEAEGQPAPVILERPSPGEICRPNHRWP